MQPKPFPNHKITETGENLSRGSPFFRSLLVGGGESASPTAASGWPSTMERKLRPSSRSTDLAGGERFSTASARASLAMARGKGFKRHPLPLALPHPGFKGGTFYLAKKRNFLLCVDKAGSRQVPGGDAVYITDRRGQRGRRFLLAREQARWAGSEQKPSMSRTCQVGIQSLPLSKSREIAIHSRSFPVRRNKCSCPESSRC